MSTRGRSSIEQSPLSKPKISDGVSNALNIVAENKILQEKEQIIEKKQTPSNIKDLILFGKVIKELSFGGFSVKISTLTNRQQKDVVKRLMKLDNEERLLNIKIFTLAEAIITINNIPLEEMIDSDGRDVFDLKVEVLSDFQSGLIDKIYNKYEEILKESNESLNSEDLEEKIKN